MKLRISDDETQILRSLTGLEIIEVYCPYIRVVENHFCAIPNACIKFAGEQNFFILEIDEKKGPVGNNQIPIECRPHLRKSSVPDTVNYAYKNEIIVGPCSTVCLEPSFRITSIVVFEYAGIVNVVEGEQIRRIETAVDKQITFYSGENKPLSAWSSNSTLYLSRDLGLHSSPLVKLQPRLVFN